MLKIIFLKGRNIFILLLGIIFSLGYFKVFGLNAKPLIFTSIVLILSFMYSGIFDVYLKNLAQKAQELLKNKINPQNIDSYTEAIRFYLKRIKEKSKGKAKFLLISKFMDEITEFEEIFPKLVENYKHGQAFLNNSNGQIEEEIQKLEKKLEDASGEAKSTYEKALQEKQATLSEIENIKASVEETQSKLYYILSTLQKIEASMESAEVEGVLTDQETTDFTSEFEAFSDALKDTKEKLRA